MTLAKTVRVIPQARAGVVERFGRYSRTLNPGLAIVIPFVDRVRPLLDLREQVVAFPPQPVITQDNVVVNVETVIYFQITDAKASSYEIADYLSAIDLLAVTTLRNVIGAMTLDQTLTSRDQVNDQLRGILDGATGKWGIRIHRVELKAIDPPASIKDTMEKQIRAEREKRAAILQAEGVKQAAITTAEGDKQSAILKAEGQRQAAILAAEGQAKAIATVFGAIHEGNPDPQLLAYQYLQMLPQLAQGDANKIWVIPSELTHALGRLSEKVLWDRGTTAKPAPEQGIQTAAALPIEEGVQRKRIVNIVFVLVAVVVSVFVIRHLVERGWPLHHANFWLVALAAVLLLGAYSAKAWGWRHLFLSGHRPATLTLAAAGGAASVAGIALPGRCDELVRFAVVRRCRRRRVSFGAVALSLFLLGLLDAVALAPMASVAAGVSNVGWWIRAGLIVVAVAGVAAGAVVLNLPASRGSRCWPASGSPAGSASTPLRGARPAGPGSASPPRGSCGRSRSSSCSPRWGSAPTSRWHSASSARPRPPRRSPWRRRRRHAGRCGRGDADRVWDAFHAGDRVRHRLAGPRHPHGSGVRGRPRRVARAGPATAARAPDRLAVTAVPRGRARSRRPLDPRAGRTHTRAPRWRHRTPGPTAPSGSPAEPSLR